MTLEQLMPFCATDETRSAWMHKPFYDPSGNYTYATDGRLMVRVPERIEGAEYFAHKNAAELFADRWPQAGAWRKLPALPPLPSAVRVTCNDCKGAGCIECEGTGHWDFTPEEFASIFGALYNTRFLHKVAALAVASGDLPVYCALASGQDEIGESRRMLCGFSADSSFEFVLMPRLEKDLRPEQIVVRAYEPEVEGKS